MLADTVAMQVKLTLFFSSYMQLYIKIFSKIYDMATSLHSCSIVKSRHRKRNSYDLKCSPCTRSWDLADVLASLHMIYIQYIFYVYHCKLYPTWLVETVSHILRLPKGDALGLSGPGEDPSMSHNRMAFSTFDRDDDGWHQGNCARV